MQVTDFMDTACLHKDNFAVELLGVPVKVDVTIAQTWRTGIDFNLMGTTYDFTVDKWRAQQFTPFLLLFHAHKPRDKDLYGSISQNEEGVVAPLVSREQKIRTVMHASKDVMLCLHQIATRYQRSVLDYAVWYREKRREEGTYAELVTRITCHCIVHMDFLAPNVSWDVVQFSD
jgi:hypothetical protein